MRNGSSPVTGPALLQFWPSAAKQFCSFPHRVRELTPKMSMPSPQKSLDETMKSLRIASNRPAWMAKMPSQVVTGASSPSPTKGCPNPKRARLCWHGFADASDPVLQAPEGAADAATEEQKPKQSASVLDELCQGASLPLDIASGALSLPPNDCEAGRQSGPEFDVFHCGAEQEKHAISPDLSGTKEAANQTAAEPKPTSGTAQPTTAIDLSPDHSSTESPAILMEISTPTAIDLSPDHGGTESPAILMEVSTPIPPSPERVTTLPGAAPPSQAAPPGAAEPKAAEPEAAEPKAVVPASAASQSQEPIQAAAASQRDTTKTPQKPEKYFDKVMLPKLEKGDSLNIAEHLVEWAPARLRAIKKAMRDPTFEAIRAEAKSVMTSYEGGTIWCIAEYRAKEGVRIMMKFSAPEKRVTVAGSHLFPMQDSCCPKHAYLYMDMLRLLVMVGEYEKATVDIIKAWHSQVKTYMEFYFQEW